MTIHKSTLQKVRQATTMFSQRKKIDAILHVAENNEGGVFKRIDENRELMELLCAEAPYLIERFPWLVHWLESQDRFLNDMAIIIGIKNNSNLTFHEYPRPWDAEKYNKLIVNARSAQKP